MIKYSKKKEIQQKTKKKKILKSEMRLKNQIGDNFILFPRKNDRVIIVGSSPIVLNNEFGKIIDEYDIVVRFNDYQTINYEKYVGSKTSIWVINDKYGIDLLTKHQKWLSDNIHVNILVMCLYKNKLGHITYDQNFDKIGNFYLKSDIKNNLLFMSKDFMKSIGNRFNIIPSSGISAILNFMQLYNNITITGFNFLVEVGNHNKFHYYSDDIHNKPFSHNSQDEKKIVTKLIEDSKIKKL